MFRSNGLVGATCLALAQKKLQTLKLMDENESSGSRPCPVPDYKKDETIPVCLPDGNTVEMALNFPYETELIWGGKGDIL